MPVDFPLKIAIDKCNRIFFRYISYEERKFYNFVTCSFSYKICLWKNTLAYFSTMSATKEKGL